MDWPYLICIILYTIKSKCTLQQITKCARIMHQLINPATPTYSCPHLPYTFTITVKPNIYLEVSTDNVTMSISDSHWSSNWVSGSGASTPPAPCNLYAETVKPEAPHICQTGWVGGKMFLPFHKYLCR